MKLNIGGNEVFDGGPGSPPLHGFVNVDFRQMPGVHVVADARALPDKWIGRIDELRASHIIEHFTFDEAQFVVKHWASMLRKGGLLRMYCPDFRKIAQDLVAGKIDMAEYSRNLFGNQTYEGNLHKCAYDQERLDWLCTNAGLRVVGRLPRPRSYAYDMGVQAKKL